jgi:hypothetical protein
LTEEVIELEARVLFEVDAVDLRVEEKAKERKEGKGSRRESEAEEGKGCTMVV